MNLVASLSVCNCMRFRVQKCDWSLGLGHIVLSDFSYFMLELFFACKYVGVLGPEPISCGR